MEAGKQSKSQETQETSQKASMKDSAKENLEFPQVIISDEQFREHVSNTSRDANRAQGQVC